MKLMLEKLGPYLIQTKIAQGGMAIVYEAIDSRSGRKVALKILPPYYAHDEGFVQRFLAEQGKVSQLEHPNIVRVYEAGHADGYYYIAFESFAGSSLAQYLEEHPGALDLNAALRMIGDLAAGLDYAHAAGVLHRDLKPSNILLANDGRALIADFGIVQPAAVQSSDAMLVGYGAGTPAFMSPEQVRGNAPDRRSDVYSLGVVAYLMITGSLPFSADNQLSLLNKIAVADPQDPKHHVADLPEGVINALRRVLAKDPAQRYATAGKFAQALVKGRDYSPGPEELAASAAAQSLPSHDPPKAPYTASKRTPQRASWLVLLLVLVALVSLGLGAFGLLSSRRQAPATASGEPAATGSNSSGDLASAQTTATTRGAASAPGAAIALPSTPASGPAPLPASSQLLVFDPVSTPTALPGPEEIVVFDWLSVPALQEDFADEPALWPSFDDGAITWRVQDGVYRLTVRPANTVAWLPLDLAIGDFMVAIQAQALNSEGGAHWGLAFRANRMASYYAIDWLPTEGLEIFKQIGEQKTILLPRVSLGSENDDLASLALAVAAVGPTLQITANDRLVATLSDASLVSGDIALYAVSDQEGAEFAFDDFALTPAKSEAKPLALIPYVDAQRAFRMHVPEQWIQRSDELGVSFDAPGSLARVAVYALPQTSGGSSAKALTDWIDKFAQYYFEEINVEEGGPLNLGGLDAYEQRGAARIKLYGLEVAVHAISVSAGNRAYAILSIAESGEEAVWRPLLDFMTSTFEPLPQPAVTSTSIMTPALAIASEPGTPAATSTPVPPSETPVKPTSTAAPTRTNIPTRRPATATPQATRPVAQPTVAASTGYQQAPVLVDPVEGASAAADQTFSWRWNGPALRDDERFDWRLLRGRTGEDAVDVRQVREQSLVYTLRNLPSGDYYWSVRVIRVDGAGRVVSILSPESARLLVRWSSAPSAPLTDTPPPVEVTDTPPPVEVTDTPPPPEPDTTAFCES